VLFDGSKRKTDFAEPYQDQIICWILTEVINITPFERTMSQPVSVLMPVYNAETYLREAIDSILNQTFSDFEFIIINDGSTDSSEAIIKSYTDPRIRYYKNENNLKLIATLNKGLALAKGKYIVRMDADDISLPTRLEKQVAFMEKHPEVVACGTWVYSFGVEDCYIKYEAGHDDIMFKMMYQCHFIHPSIIMRAHVVKSFTPQFDFRYAHAEDYDFFVRLGYRHKLANIREVLLHYRTHEKSVSKEYKETQKLNSRIIIHQQFEHLGYPVSDQLIDDFTELNHHAYTKVKSTPLQVKQFLEHMLRANHHSHVFSKDFLEKKLSYLWFHYCYKVSTPKVFYSSNILTKYSKPTALQTIRWQVKSLKA